MNVPLAITTIAITVKSDIPMDHLNFFATFGTSVKKFADSTSLDVAPHCMSISNMWQRRAWETCIEMPPKKMANIKHHLKFSATTRRIRISTIRQ